MIFTAFHQLPNIFKRLLQKDIFNLVLCWKLYDLSLYMTFNVAAQKMILDTVQHGMCLRNTFWLMASNCWLKLFLIDCYNSSIKRPNQCFWVNYNTLSSHVLYKICIPTILLWMLMMIIMASVNKFMHIKCITALYTRHLHFNVLPATSVF